MIAVSKQGQTVIAVVVIFLIGSFLLHKNDMIPKSLQLKAQLKIQPVKPIRPIETREMIANILEEEKFEVGAELGVQKGIYAEHNLKIWKSCKRYYLVDAWAHQENYHDAANVNNAVHNEFYQETKRRMAPFGNVPQFLRMYTSDAVKEIADNSLDFLYVDARHDYCGTLADLEDYYPKMKSGSIIAGHDYLNSDDLFKQDRSQDWSICGDGSVNRGAVRGAVETFAERRGLQIVLAYKDGGFPSFMIRVP